MKNYAQGNIKFKISINTSRFFMNEKTLASLLGAMLECGYDDYTFNGFSNEKGESVGGSTSHKNGYNGDLRFLRKDKSGKGVYLNKISEDGDPCGWKGMDEARQNKFNDALFRFGWKSMLCSYYTGKLLNNCTADEDHYDHLHVQSYTPDFKEVKE
ncbi:MAG: hypothetical protein H7329_02910 [Opitutaceae bacterium]|nr:hypothetical protein [Cytophagales bacterium]